MLEITVRMKESDYYSLLGIVRDATGELKAGLGQYKGKLKRAKVEKEIKNLEGAIALREGAIAEYMRIADALKYARKSVYEPDYC